MIGAYYANKLNWSIYRNAKEKIQLTQSELAEQLDVLESLVCSWENDESIPDYELIPKISEILGVTPSDLLQGEQISTDSEQENAKPYEANFTSSEQAELNYLGSKTKLNFLYLSIFNCTAGLFGLLIAMLFNFGFKIPAVGFYLGMIFILAAVICEVLLLINSRYNLNEKITDELISEKSNENNYYNKIFKNTIIALSFISATMLPLSFTNRISYSGWIIGSFVLSILTLIIIAIVKADLRARKNPNSNLNIIFTKDERKKKYIKKLNSKFILTCVIFLALLIGSRMVVTTYFEETLIDKLFTNVEEFHSYIEQEPTIKEEDNDEESDEESFYEEEGYYEGDDYYEEVYTNDYDEESDEKDDEKYTSRIRVNDILVLEYNYINTDVVHVRVETDGYNNLTEIHTYKVEYPEEMIKFSLLLDDIYFFIIIFYLAISTIIYFIKRKKLMLELKTHFE